MRRLPDPPPEESIEDLAAEMREEMIAAYRLRLRDKGSTVIELGLMDDDFPANDEGF